MSKMKLIERLERNKMILQVSSMHLTHKESVMVLNKEGYEMTVGAYSKQLDRLKKKSREELHTNTQEFAAKHLQRIKSFERISRKLWHIAETAKHDKDKIAALDSLRELQHDMTTYDELSQLAIQEDMRISAAREALR